MENQPTITFDDGWFINGKPATREEVDELLKQYIDLGDKQGDND